MHPETEVGRHEQDESDQRKKGRIDRLHNPILEAHLLNVKEADQPGEE